MATERGLRVTHVINTHGHEDHTNGNDELVRASGALVAAHPDCPVAKTIALMDEDTLSVGSLRVRALFTPGHTPDSLTLVVEDAAFTGDLLFVGKVGGTHTEAEARLEYESLWEKVFTLPDATRVYPGHNYGTKPSSTIGEERRTNPFLQQPSFEAFWHLKQNWAAYKKAHGIA
jgi:glyoxylase-like metal-dependent hydrolase (beta-lactamase superfamily II)